MKKTKKASICILIIMMIVMLLVVIYLKTDLFKTKEQLFWKYFLKEKDEIISIVSNNETKQYNEKIKKSSYIKKGNISLVWKRNFFKPINIKIEEKGNNAEECKNIFINMKYDNKDINETTIIEDGDYYYLKNELVDNNYIGFENNNLKQVAKKIGISNTDFIPNKIKDIDYVELFSLSDEETKHILKKYIPVCRKIIKNKDYTKEKNVKLEKKRVTKYGVQVTKKQFNNLCIEILKELKNDEKTLDIISRKIKSLDETNKYCEMNNLKNRIDECIGYLEHRDVDDEIFLSIIIYKNENDVEKIELVMNDDRTISIQNDKKNKIIIKQYGIKENKLDTKSFEGIVRTAINSIYEITYEKQIENNDIKKVDVNIKCNFGIEQFSINYNYVEQIKNNVEEIIRKDDITYLDLNKISNKTFKNVIEKVLKLKAFLTW